MEEICTCMCGNQSWIIDRESLRCTKCHAEYPNMVFASIKDFNIKRQEEAELMGD